MKISSNSKLNLKDIGLFIGVAILTVAAFFCTYHFAFSTAVKLIIWLAWFVLSGVLTFFTQIGKRVLIFANEAKIELFKVVWPTRQETVQTTTIVMVMVAATGFILWGVDSIMLWAVAKVTHLG